MFRPKPTNSEQTLFAVAPDHLGRSKPPIGNNRPVERVEFNSQLRFRAIMAYLWLTLFLLLWAYFTEIDDIAQATGQLIPAQQVQLMRAALDGKVEDICVREGERVSKGDLLVSLNKASYAVELKKYQHELKIAEREFERHVHAEQVIRDYLKQPGMLSPDLSGVTAVAQAIGQLYASHQRLQRAVFDNRRANSDSEAVSKMGALEFQQSHLAQQRKYKEIALGHRLNQFLLQERKLIERIESLKRQVELQQLSVVQKGEAVKIARKQLDAYEKAFKSGASSKTECLDAKIRFEDAERDLTLVQTSARGTLGALQAAEHELGQQRFGHTMERLQMEGALKDLSASGSQVPLKMRAAERELSEARSLYEVALRNAQAEQANERAEIILHEKHVAELKAMIEAQVHILEKCDLRAPVDGVIALMHLQGPGQVVKRGETLLTVVPSNESLLVEAHVLNSDIAFVYKGQPVRLELPAYPYQQYGTITGIVTQVDDSPANDKEHSTAYRILVKPDRDWMLCDGQKFLLRKGLDVNVQIILRKRRLLVMQLAPLLKFQYSHFKG